MSLQIRVAIEIGESRDDAEAGGKAAYVRLDHRETVMPATADDDPVDVIALGKATLERIQADIGQRAAEQLSQLTAALEQAA